MAVGARRPPRPRQGAAQREHARRHPPRERLPGRRPGPHRSLRGAARLAARRGVEGRDRRLQRAGGCSPTAPASPGRALHEAGRRGRRRVEEHRPALADHAVRCAARERAHPLRHGGARGCGNHVNRGEHRGDPPR
ncbi:hypothetical protein ACFPRL_27605 [Pseudoclavibacter helvolus]